MTFTATVSGCTAPSYLWYVYDATNWMAQGTWTGRQSFTYRPTAPGIFSVAFTSKQFGTTPVNGQYDTVTYSTNISVTGEACSNPSITFQPNVNSVPANTKVVFTASVTGCSLANYQWYVFNGTTWLVQGTWSASNTFPWTPTTPGGNYLVGFTARQQGSTPANGQYDSFTNSAAFAGD